MVSQVDELFQYLCYLRRPRKSGNDRGMRAPYQYEQCDLSPMTSSTSIVILAVEFTELSP